MLTIRREVTLEGVWGSFPRSSLFPGMGGAKAQVWIVFDLFEGPAQRVWEECQEAGDQEASLGQAENCKERTG